MEKDIEDIYSTIKPIRESSLINAVCDLRELVA